MQDNELVCTLTAADYRDREPAWLKLGTYLSASEVIQGGLRFRFAPTRGLKDSLTELVRLEAECCAWMAFAMSDSPDGIRLSITSTGEDGERAVRETFARLVSVSGPDARLTT
jgi:hypothetical protein